jgi:hypothetical protein
LAVLASVLQALLYLRVFSWQLPKKDNFKIPQKGLGI